MGDFSWESFSILWLLQMAFFQESIPPSKGRWWEALHCEARGSGEAAPRKAIAALFSHAASPLPASNTRRQVRRQRPVELEDFHFPVTNLHATDVISLALDLTKGGCSWLRGRPIVYERQRQEALSLMGFPGEQGCGLENFPQGHGFLEKWLTLETQS